MPESPSLEETQRLLGWLRGLDVTLHGDRATEGITPGALTSWLDGLGWTVTTLARSGEFRCKEGVRHSHGDVVFVPLNASFADYARRVRDLVTDVAEAEGCGVLGLLIDLRRASADQPVRGGGRA